ncbi:NtaA/DmoA family FMN-dependent monooxygenase [Amycolatopsis acidiphila]|uniref:NtaA/DmoA family FMN-dependent monooxygenase n=1 Tax=Amycolatopsis acidiphila TaxID=715473 RepID=A0A558ACH8_9PSEU|nr:NtaA/DmoA family FMN-dependent monooxygenase [Amycolatopsis acidiphila]TVT21945.1 NtaA/DmoA family FMN-dependent monooxygenase [Amycolatopsis acidiphila]UIJ57369.1 NtaA/DmoA family FMN-dependent monooxygenase [Amycolatopsis acidiphila]GHG84579.1 monooxygenase [Amycolatopsis acidiphila]
MSARELHFNAFVWPNGYHESAWQVVDDDVRGVLGLPYYANIARIAERGLMDTVFLADNIAIAEYRTTHLPQTQFDPISVLSALAGVTSHIGLIGTGSTTYNKPWELARRFATLDHLSGGRAGWNIVTTVTPLAAANYGESAHPEHGDRYTRAHEFVDVVTRAWDSWEDEAVVGDRARGVWADRGKLHAPRFHGQFYDVEGILPFPRSPQGWPVLVQAGQSPAGVALAARYAELVFSGPPSLEAAVAFRTDLHAQASAAGRDPAQLLVLPALMVTLGGTEAEAKEKAQRLEDLASPEFRWQNVLYTAGLDPDAFDPDVPLPAELWTGKAAPSSRAEQLYAAARARPDASLRDITADLKSGAGQFHFVGTPEQLADHVIAWQDAGAVDGFTIMGSTLPYELTTFVDHVVPILQRKGRFRTGYAGSTLRDHLGLPRPPAGRETRR